MASRKAWGEHSPRWQREALRDGLSPKRWDAWRALSPKSRAESDPRAYARGKSVPQQRLEHKRAAAVDAIMAAKSGVARRYTVMRGVAAMPTNELNKINAMPPQKLDGFVSKMAARPMPPGVRNPYWYR